MTPAARVHEPAVLARAFLALSDGEPATQPRAVPPAVVVLLAAIVLAMSAPLLWAGLAADVHDRAAIAPHRTAFAGGDDDGPGGP